MAVELTREMDADPIATETVPEAYVVACLVQGEWQRAMTVIDELGPVAAYAPHLAAAAGRLLASRRHDEAVRVASKAVELDENCAAAHSVLGQALAAPVPQNGQPGLEPTAEAELRRALELDPRDAASRMSLASLYMQQDRLAEARGPIEEALSLDPSDEAAREALKRLRKAVKSAAAKQGTSPSGDSGSASEEEQLRRLAAQVHQRSADAARQVKERPSVSLCLITRDEARNLPRVVESVRGLVTEIIVVDTGSTDDTVRIARRLKATIASIPWEDDFAAARNHSLKLATGDWILVLDADDQLTRDSLPALCRWLAHAGEVDVVGLFRRYPHPEMQRDSVSVQPRLFRNHRGLHFRGAIHEQLFTADGRPAQPDTTLTATIYHHGALDGPDATRRRRIRNRRILEKTLEREPGDARLRFYLGFTLFEGEAWNDAVPHLEAAIQIADTECDFVAKAYACLGNALLNAHRPLDAEAVVRNGLELFPDYPELWFCLGLVLDALGRLEAAAEAHEAALRARFGPSLNWHDWACREAKPHLALCDLRLTLGDTESSARHLAAAEQFTGPQPLHEPIRKAIAETAADHARQVEERERLIAGWEAAFAAGDPTAGLSLVTALLEMGQMDRAQRVVDDWRAREGSTPEALLAQGQLLLASRAPSEAMEAFVSVREAEPENADAWRGEAEAWRAIGRPEEAEKALLEAARVGNDAAAAEAVGEFYLGHERWDDAIRWLQRSLELRDDAWTAWLSLGRAMLGAGNLPNAMPCYQRAATLSNGNAAVRVALGEARARLARVSKMKESGSREPGSLQPSLTR